MSWGPKSGVPGRRYGLHSHNDDEETLRRKLNVLSQITETARRINAQPRYGPIEIEIIDKL